MAEWFWMRKLACVHVFSPKFKTTWLVCNKTSKIYKLLKSKETSNFVLALDPDRGSTREYVHHLYNASLNNEFQLKCAISLQMLCQLFTRPFKKQSQLSKLSYKINLNFTLVICRIIVCDNVKPKSALLCFLIQYSTYIFLLF